MDTSRDLRRCLLLTAMILSLGARDNLIAKKPLDQGMPPDWPLLHCRDITSDGKYVAYTVTTAADGDTLVIQATEGLWEKRISSAEYHSAFTADSRRLIFEKRGSGVGILDLGTEVLRYLNGATEFTAPKHGNGRWLVYRTAASPTDLMLLDLTTGAEKSFANVKAFQLNDCGSVLLMCVAATEGSSGAESLEYFDLDSGKSARVCQGCDTSGFVFGADGAEFAFVAKQPINGQIDTTLRYYHPGFPIAQLLVNSATPGMDQMEIKQIVSTGEHGNEILFTLGKADYGHGEAAGPSSTSAAAPVIRNYRDDSGFVIRGTESLLAVYHSAPIGKVVRLQEAGERLVAINSVAYYVKGDGECVIVSRGCRKLSKTGIRMGETYSSFDYDLVSVRDGSRCAIARDLAAQSAVEFSLVGKYVVWYDVDCKNWFSYNIAHATAICISAGIARPLAREGLDSLDPARPPGSYPVVGWLTDDASLLISDQRDVWQVDPDGLKPAINVTQGYGLAHGIQFARLDLDEAQPSPIQPGGTVLLAAFDHATKMTGFFELRLDRQSAPEQLTLEARKYYFSGLDCGNLHCGGGNITPARKAAEAETFVLRCGSEVDYPNLYVTHDFRTFRTLTHLQPERDYNWYITELLRWTLPDGTPTQGILFKPEDFDAAKKYPVIVYIYQTGADDLHAFIDPVSSTGGLNIPWYVSNGYLVFFPDLHYKKGHPGKSASDGVVSAAEQLAHLPYVDARHMGLQGHSYGGYEVNFILTQTDLFAAAASAEGPSDLISSTASGDYHWYYFYESGQGKIGASLWQRPELYVENSPVFRADKVTTPLLILDNEKDTTVLPDQGKEWYYSLSRLGKKVWMVSYRDEDHTIDKSINQRDYSIRLGQFFDHYLKGAPPPNWMTHSVATGKRNYDSLQLDTSGNEP